GPGNVQQAVQRTGYADFWELYKRNVLPAETKNYVPIILAVTIMAKNPSQYGLENLQPDAPLRYDLLKVDYPVDLRLVSEITDSSLSTIQGLNPALLRMTTPKEGTYELKLPLGTSAHFQQVIATIPRDMRVWWRYHKVASGETLAGIAHEYRTTTSAIAEVNSFDSEEDLKPGSRLIIPVAPGRDAEHVAYSKHPTMYKVRKGDTVLSVADDFSVPVAKLRTWNHLKGNSLLPGHTLRIYRPVAGGEAPETHAASRTGSSNSHSKSSLQAKSRTVHHTVKKGETLSSIAESYNTTVAELRKDNGHAAAHLQAGTVLVVRTGE
ncbi:MAG TPA: LysM peptidoglycan-binding domain-containing protein, partial [Terriglobales bacterium]|nr:LysM peptidoglycan-binding domain-containing protein [Terriglobales bacterium]